MAGRLGQSIFTTAGLMWWFQCVVVSLSAQMSFSSVGCENLWGESVTIINLTSQTKIQWPLSYKINDLGEEYFHVFSLPISFIFSDVSVCIILYFVNCKNYPSTALYTWGEYSCVCFFHFVDHSAAAQQESVQRATSSTDYENCTAALLLCVCVCVLLYKHLVRYSNSKPSITQCLWIVLAWHGVWWLVEAWGGGPNQTPGGRPSGLSILCTPDWKILSV